MFLNEKLPLLVLIGGLGTRLKKIYPDTPKFLVPINSEANFADYWIKSLDYSCISHIYFLTGYKSHMIEQYLNKKKLKVEYTIINEGDKLLGTGGAIKKACREISSSFFVTYGDSILNVSWKKMLNLFLSTNSPLTLSIIYNDNLTDKSNIFINEKNQLYYNKNNRSPKMKYIDYGLSIINIDDFKRTTKELKIFDLANWFNYVTLFNSNIPFIRAEERYYEIGTPHALEDFRKNFSKSSLRKF